MKITILGATGKTGRALLTLALQGGHHVTALVRHTEGLPQSDHLLVITGDVTESRDIAKASQGADVIISTLGPGGNGLMTNTVKAVIAAARETGVKRFILMSSFAVKKQRLSIGMRLMSGIAMGKMVEDKQTSEELLRGSGLDYTIVYATLLNDGMMNAKVRVPKAEERLGMKNKISRASVAAWMLREAEKGEYAGQDVIITE
ncbi:MAG: SDR family oxidoreductase [Bifidobacterium sp.]|jgi:uncharacterized protein YbjT (DUF2867 family)|nr:SDR family oxidoreductase [Bifidobacterium sp.]MCH4174254.1 SDR family oxidoreductase [Bifidobacterium sp.]